MNLYIYSDESGVLDKVHNDYFVFGWIILLDKKDRHDANMLYLNAEKAISNKYKGELKASLVTNKDKGKLFRSLNHFSKGGLVIHQKNVLDSVFGDKKTKQRFLDFVYKIGVKRHLQNLIESKVIEPFDIKEIFFYNDEHTTATNGLYELREGLLQEFKYGTHNWNYGTFYQPIFPKLSDVHLSYCASDKVRLVRSADIVANRIYNRAVSGNLTEISEKVFINNFYWRKGRLD
ncbi:MAG: DUF3800 domain-containing protein [Streptococcaceae bacterium]|jgi:hypothetical protein|nr:DUF3800 domain-containing protein [Streptococcaceae bacterium]